MTGEYRSFVFVSAGLLAVFCAGFVLNSIFGWITIEGVRAALTKLHAEPRSAIWIAGAVILLLSVDSLLSVSTLATVTLAGFFLGPVLGGSVSSVGLLAAGSLCFFGSRYGGPKILRHLSTDASSDRLKQWFAAHGGLALILARAVPMLPELLSCLAGLSKMRVPAFYFYFSLGSIPYAFLAAWAGSQSSLEYPWPAVLTGIAIPALSTLIWYGVRAR